EVDEGIAQDVIFALRDAFIKGRQCIVRYDRPKEEREFGGRDRDRSRLRRKDDKGDGFKDKKKPRDSKKSKNERS
ncbi:MAG: hypothetical protein LUC43_04515, partial [Burkholderiales bacterium]|nr:hypothetical protein [Burkholderiales bacterium]